MLREIGDWIEVDEMRQVDGRWTHVKGLLQHFTSLDIEGHNSAHISFSISVLWIPSTQVSRHTKILCLERQRVSDMVFPKKKCIYHVNILKMSSYSFLSLKMSESINMQIFISFQKFSFWTQDVS